jgi:hypothetical protein
MPPPPPSSTSGGQRALQHTDVLTIPTAEAAVYAPHVIRDELADAFDDDPQHGIGTQGDTAAAKHSWAMFGAGPSDNDDKIRALVAAHLAKQQQQSGS